MINIALCMVVLTFYCKSLHCSKCCKCVACLLQWACTWAAVCVCVFTSLCVIQVDKLVPFVVCDQAEHHPFKGGSQLKQEMSVRISGLWWSDERGVQSPRKWQECVHWALIIKTKYGIHTSWELRTNCKERKREREKLLVGWANGPF